MSVKDTRDTQGYLTTSNTGNDQQYQQYQNININPQYVNSAGDFIIQGQQSPPAAWYSDSVGISINPNDFPVEISESILKDPEALKEYLKVFTPTLSLIPEKVRKHVIVRKEDIEDMDPKEIARLRLDGVTITG